jgi:hypothetical protein
MGQVWELDGVSWRGPRMYLCLGLVRSKHQPRQDAYLMLPLEDTPLPIERARYLFDNPIFNYSLGIEKWKRLA